MVSLLTSAGASLTSCDLVQFTPAHWAAWWGRDQILQHFLVGFISNYSQLKESFPDYFPMPKLLGVCCLLRGRHTPSSGSMERSPENLHFADGEGE